jgi:hypothetical protein
LDERKVRRAAVTQELMDHGLGLPERMRQSVQDNLAKARAGHIPDLAQAGEWLTNSLARFAYLLKEIAYLAGRTRDAGYPLERVERLSTAVAEMVRLTEETIEAWPWPEGWWPAVNQEMLKRSYEEGEFLTREETIRELLQRTSWQGS